MARSKMVRCKTKHDRKKSRRASGKANFRSAGAACVVQGASSRPAFGRHRDEDYQPANRVSHGVKQCYYAGKYSDW